jgi:TIR domain
MEALSNRPPVEVFCSYVERDRAQLETLITHLSMLEQRGLISIWYVGKANAGSHLFDEIDAHIASAQIILLLVSPDYLASSEAQRIEAQILRKNASEETPVIPILLRPTVWQNSSFSHLQALPLNGKFVSTWEDKDEVAVDASQLYGKDLPNPLHVATNAGQRIWPVDRCPDAATRNLIFD